MADLVTSRDDPYFARVAVNRLWAKMMGRGLVEPVDAFGPGNPPSHPELLDYLAMEFIQHGYDLKHILRLIALSRTYHLSSTGPPLPSKAGDGPFFERMALRRMSAEQLHDSILTATGLRGIDDGVYRPAIEKRYPAVCKKDGRLLVGFSKSGWGAFSLLLRHPDMFGKAAAWDAPLMKTKPNQFGMGPIFGTQKNFENYRISTLAVKQADKLGKKPRLILTGYGNFRRHHQQLHRLMVERNFPHEYIDGPKRKHRWSSGWLEETVKRLRQ